MPPNQSYDDFACPFNDAIPAISYNKSSVYLIITIILILYYKKTMTFLSDRFDMCIKNILIIYRLLAGSTAE